MFVSRLVGLCCIGLLSLPVAAEKSLRIATTDYPPYASPALPQRGPLVQLTLRAFAAVGQQVEVDFLPWARAMRLTEIKQYDGLLLLWPEEIKKLQLWASDALYLSELGVFVTAGSTRQIADTESLRDARLGIVRDYGYPPELLHSGARLDIADDDKTNVRKLALGRLDVVLLEKSAGEYLLNHELAPLCQKIRWGGKSLARLPLAIGFNDEARLNQFNTGLALLKASGEYQRLLAALDRSAATGRGGDNEVCAN